jgi:hydrogenase expression/formation protein HypC
MCLAIPAKVTLIDEDGMGKVDIGGVIRDACFTLMKEIKLGDYVLIHAGFAIERLDEKEALETLELFRKIDALGI